MSEIFVSHTKKETQFCDLFDTVVARVEVKAFRSELENIPPPAWKTIKQSINNSSALFFLVGPAFVNHQRLGGRDWQFTQNWIAYEIGVACLKGIDVWIVCDHNIYPVFPMPYVNNYFTYDLRNPKLFAFMRNILEWYLTQKKNYPLLPNAIVICPHCKIEFNFFGISFGIKCPCCLNVFKNPTKK